MVHKVGGWMEYIIFVKHKNPIRLLLLTSASAYLAADFAREL